MFRRLGRPTVAALFAVAIFAVLAIGASGASANRLRPHFTAKQKAAIHKTLARQLRHNPRVIRSPKWIRQAAITDYQLPLTIRLNRKTAVGSPGTFSASNDSALIDLGASFNQVNATLYGAVHAVGRFADPFEGGTLGQIDVSVPTDSAGSGSLYTNPINLLSNADVTGQTVANGGCSDYDYSQTTVPGVNGGNPFNDPADVPGAYGDVPANNVFRTAALTLGVNSGGGVANLLSDGTADQGARLALNLNARVWTIFRVLDANSPLNCLQAVTGFVDNPLPAKVLGSLKINPTTTVDNELRLATISVHGVPTNINVTACLVPFVPFFAVAGTAMPGAPCNFHPAPVDAFGVPVLNGTNTVQLNGNLNVTTLTGEVLIGNTGANIEDTGGLTGSGTH